MHTLKSKRAATAALLCATLMLAGNHAAHAQSNTSLQFSDIAGWWSADPTYAGESSRVALHLLEDGGKPTARLSLLAIGGYEMPLGTVTLSGNTIDMQSYSFPLTYDATRGTLSGYLLKDAVPVYKIPVEFHRSEPLAKPAPPAWSISKPPVKWTADLGSPVWAGLERDAETRLLFVATEQGILHALDGGSTKWTFDTAKPIKARPAVIGNAVYVASDSGYLYKLDKRSGAEMWRAKIDAGSPPRIPTNQENSRWDRYGSSVVADSKQLYVASRDNHLYALDIDSGKEVWRVASKDMMTATPALYRDAVLMASFDGKVQSVSARDGKVRWTYDAKLTVPGDMVVEGDRLLIGSRTYDLVALDAASGKELWKHYYWFSWIESPPVVRDGVAYTGTSDATKVYAVDVAAGRLRWKTAVPGWAWARTAVNDEVVVAGTVGVGAYPGVRGGSLVALDRRSGEIRWLYLDPPSPKVVEEKKGWGFGASPVIADGIVYAADLNGRVYAMSLQSAR